MVESQAPQVSAHWLDKIKMALHLDKLQFSTGKLIEIGIYFGLGFLVGYLFKRFSAFFIFVVITFLGIYLLNQFEIINFSINATKLCELLGIQTAPNVNIVYCYFASVKENIVSLLSFLIGFFVGISLA
jgi:uncharacterized membrane protein (Fun14 family)